MSSLSRSPLSSTGLFSVRRVKKKNWNELYAVSCFLRVPASYRMSYFVLFCSYLLQIKSFLNSFYDNKFAKNKDSQINELKKFIEKQKIKKNFIFVTHYVVISEILDYYPKSGEIIVSDRNFNVLKTFDTKY